MGLKRRPATGPPRLTGDLLSIHPETGRRHNALNRFEGGQGASHRGHHIVQCLPRHDFRTSETTRQIANPAPRVPNPLRWGQTGEEPLRPPLGVHHRPRRLGKGGGG